MNHLVMYTTVPTTAVLMAGDRSQLTSKVSKVHSIHEPSWGRLTSQDPQVCQHPPQCAAWLRRLQYWEVHPPVYLQQILFSACEQWDAGLFYKDQPARKIRHWWLQLLCGSSRASPWITHALRSQGHSATKIHSLSFCALFGLKLWFLLQASCLTVSGSASRLQRKYAPRALQHWQAQFPWRDLEHASCCSDRALRAHLQVGAALLFLWSKLQPFWPLRHKY